MGRPLLQQGGAGNADVDEVVDEVKLAAVNGYGFVVKSVELQATVDADVLPKADVCEAASGVNVPAELSLLLLVALTSATAAGDGLMDEEFEVKVVAARGDCTFG